MTVGLVVVSHSSKIAEGVAELAGQMADGVAIEPAGGTEADGIGTSFEKVQAAIDRADSGDGVVVLCDLGSAVMTAETALDFLDDAARARVRIADAPVVEGAVAAAVAAQVGDDLEAVLRAALSANAAPVGNAGSAAEPPVPADHAGSGTPADPLVRRVTLVNPSGLHARPAAEFVKAASGFEATVTVNGVDAKSLLRIMGLGLGKGATAQLAAEGRDAAAALDALAELVESGFGEV